MAEATDEQQADMRQAKCTAAIFQALGAPLRVRLVEELADGSERTIPELVDRVGAALVSPGNVSSHLGVLYQAGVVECRRAGNRSYYTLRYPRLAELCRLVVALSRMSRA